MSEHGKTFHLLECPDPVQRRLKDPSQYSRYVRSASWRCDFRVLIFTMRQPGEPDDQKETAENLGPEWNEAIAEYWRRTEIAIEWEKRQTELKRQDEERRKRREYNASNFGLK